MNCIVKHLLSPFSQWISIVGLSAPHQYHTTTTATYANADYDTGNYERVKQTEQEREKERKGTHKHIKKHFRFRLYLSYGVYIRCRYRCTHIRWAKNSVRNPGQCFESLWSSNSPKNRVSYTSLVRIQTDILVAIAIAIAIYTCTISLSPFLLLFFSLGFLVNNQHSCSSNLLL